MRAFGIQIGEAQGVIESIPPTGDLVWLFEGEPSHPLGSETWPYAPVRYALTRGTDHLEVEIEPADGAVTVELHHNGHQMIHLGLTRVHGIGTERRPDRELLRIDFEDDVPADSLWLQTKPSLAVTWQLNSD